MQKDATSPSLFLEHIHRAVLRCSLVAGQRRDVDLLRAAFLLSEVYSAALMDQDVARRRIAAAYEQAEAFAEQEEHLTSIFEHTDAPPTASSPNESTPTTNIGVRNSGDSMP